MDRVSKCYVPIHALSRNRGTWPPVTLQRLTDTARLAGSAEHGERA